MTRVYDTSKIFRNGTLRNIQHLYDELVAIHENIERLEREVDAIENRLRWLKKEMGFND